MNEGLSPKHQLFQTFWKLISASYPRTVVCLQLWLRVGLEHVCAAKVAPGQRWHWDVVEEILTQCFPRGALVTLLLLNRALAFRYLHLVHGCREPSEFLVTDSLFDANLVVSLNRLHVLCKFIIIKQRIHLLDAQTSSKVFSLGRPP